MHPIGKIIVLSCLLIIAGALFLQNSEDENLKRLRETVSVPSIIPPKEEVVSDIGNIFSNQNNQPKLDLQGPWRCVLKQDATEIGVYISNQKIKANLKTEQNNSVVLVRDDAVYSYSQGKNSGTVLKGANQYIDLFSSLSSFLPNTSIFTALESFFPKDAISQELSTKLLSECKKGAVEEEQFALPNGVRFSEVSVEEFVNTGSETLKDLNSNP